MRAIPLVQLILAAFPLLPTTSWAAGVDTEHMFGFSEGTDIGEPFQPEAEFESIGRVGKSSGTYSALTTTANLKYPLSKQFRIAPGIAFSRYDISNVPTFPDTNELVFDHALFELRWHPLARETNPVGLTFIATPYYGTVDPANGAPADSYGAQFIAAVDQALVPDKVFAAFNLAYTLNRTRTYATGVTADSALLGISVASSVRLLPWLYAGGELRYLQSYDGFAFEGLAGHALYVGPTFYATLGNGVSLSGAWEIQTWGQSPGFTSGLDLATFDRQQFKIRLAFDL